MNWDLGKKNRIWAAFGLGNGVPTNPFTFFRTLLEMAVL